MAEHLAAVVLCAGKGTRMKSERAKVLHALLGRPLCFYPVARAFAVGASKVVAVVGHQAEDVTQALLQVFPGQPLRFCTQAEQRGTAHAVRCAEETLKGWNGPVLILYGDTPLLRSETLEALVAAFHSSGGRLAMVTTFPPDPKGYGRVLRHDGRVFSVVEEKDATDGQRAVRECNAGIYVASGAFLWPALAQIRPANAQGEFYLTDLVAQASALGEVGAVVADFEETAGVNDRVELARAGAALRARINAAHMRAGVTFEHPESAFVDEGVEIGVNTVVGPNVALRGATRLGTEVVVGQGCVLVASEVEDGAELKPYSVLEEARVGPRCQVGPFARLRPGSVLDEDVHVGNFVETKKAHLGKGTKAGHLAYLGDAEIGAGVNVGAGTITCNYDGEKKHQTVLGDGVFIGSDSQLVAPVTVGAGAYVGAGTTVTEDVPPGSLAVSRAPQVVKEGWVAKRKAGRSKG